MTKRYDYAGARFKIDTLVALGMLLEAELGIEEDWAWTVETVWELGEYKIDLNQEPKIAGIDGSFWGTPTLKLGLKDGRTAVYDCFVPVTESVSLPQR